MNAIQYSINSVLHRINRTVLEMVFTNDMFVNNSLEDKIYNRVIKSRVLPDLDVTGGIMITLPLSRCNIVSQSDTYSVYQIPASLRDNKPIMSALSMISVQGYYMEHYSSLAEMMSGRVAQRNEIIPIHSTARLEVISDDTVIVHDYIIDPTIYSMRIVVANDPYLNNLHTRFYPDFGELVVLAVKAYIYNQLEINLDKGFIVSGHRLDNIQRIVERWESADEKYMELIKTKWYKLQFMNRTESMKRMVSWMIPNSI